MADGRGTTRLTTAITSSQCGLVALWVEQVKIWDLFHLFGKRIETDGKEELSVLPEYYEALIEITPQIRERLIESEEYDEKRPGDDPSQISRSGGTGKVTGCRGSTGKPVRVPVS